MQIINANNYATYVEAWDAYYDGVVPKYGATRMDWGFGRWLFLDHDLTQGIDDIAFWELLDRIGILTADGRKRLSRAKKQRGVLNEKAKPGEAHGRADGGDRQARADGDAENRGTDDVPDSLAGAANRAQDDEGGAA